MGIFIIKGSALGASVEGSEIVIASQASGDIMYFDGTNWVVLAKGTADQFLKHDNTVPSWTKLVNANVTSGEFANITGFGSLTKELDLGAAVNLSIVANDVTVTTSNHTIDTENDDATDNLEFLEGVANGDILFFTSLSSARDPTLVDSTANNGAVNAAGNFTFDSNYDCMLIKKYPASALWQEVSRSNNL